MNSKITYFHRSGNKNKNKTYEVDGFSSNTLFILNKFTVYKNKAGEYKIVNIIIDGINLDLHLETISRGFKKSNFDLDEATLNHYQAKSYLVLKMERLIIKGGNQLHEVECSGAKCRSPNFSLYNSFR